MTLDVVVVLDAGGGEEVLVPVTTAQGEINAGEWAYFEVDVDESWNAMEIGCEASAGFIIIQKVACIGFDEHTS